MKCIYLHIMEKVYKIIKKKQYTAHLRLPYNRKGG